MRQLRFLLDQMLDEAVAAALSGLGHDVLRVSSVGMAREDDAGILQKAVDERRILITLDEHFGDWVVLPLSKHPGVIRVKAHPATTNQILSVLRPFLDEHSDRDFTNSLVRGIQLTGVATICWGCAPSGRMAFGILQFPGRCPGLWNSTLSAWLSAG